MCKEARILFDNARGSDAEEVRTLAELGNPYAFLAVLEEHFDELTDKASDIECNLNELTESIETAKDEARTVLQTAEESLFPHRFEKEDIHVSKG